VIKMNKVVLEFDLVSGRDTTIEIPSRILERLEIFRRDNPSDEFCINNNRIDCSGLNDTYFYFSEFVNDISDSDDLSADEARFIGYFVCKDIPWEGGLPFYEEVECEDRLVVLYGWNVDENGAMRIEGRKSLNGKKLKIKGK